MEKRDCRLFRGTDIDRFVAIKGLVIRTSNVIPDLRVGACARVPCFLACWCRSLNSGGLGRRIAAYFECLKCNTPVTVNVERGRVEEPTRCTNCNASRSLLHVYNRCEYADKQVIRLQETPGRRGCRNGQCGCCAAPTCSHFDDSAQMLFRTGRRHTP
jgi:DNA replication licensing factor MCM4